MALPTTYRRWSPDLRRNRVYLWRDPVAGGLRLRLPADEGQGQVAGAGVALGVHAALGRALRALGAGRAGPEAGGAGHGGAGAVGAGRTLVRWAGRAGAADGDVHGALRLCEVAVRRPHAVVREAARARSEE